MRGAAAISRRAIARELRGRRAMARVQSLTERVRDRVVPTAKSLRARVRSRLDLRSDARFLEDAYRLVVRRPADPSGLAFYGSMLASGMTREELLVQLALSEESMNRALAEHFVIQDLRELRPDSYDDIVDSAGNRISVFTVREPSDFDWLERSILEYDYYEKPGIWTLAIDEDKRRMAEIVACLCPDRALEIGCSSGAVLSCLRDRGVDAEGVEISAAAIRRAEPAVRSRIHRGDLLSVDVPDTYSVVFGLDIFEHFNPNKLDAYIDRVASLTEAEGLVFANVPTWGADRVYGTIWEPLLPSWIDDIKHNRLFRQLQVDEHGYPMHGHLVWAGSDWWEQRFVAAGLTREVEIERALHRRFDAALRATPARMAFYVFSRQASPSRLERVLRACARA